MSVSIFLSHSQAGIKIANHFEKIGLVGTIIVFLIVHFNLANPKYPIVAYVASFMPFLVSLIVVKFIAKFAYKIIIDLEKNEISFYLFRKKDVITTKISDIKEVYINLYMNFIFCGQKIKYYEATNNNLIKIMQKFAPVSWGKLGKVFHGIK